MKTIQNQTLNIVELSSDLESLLGHIQEYEEGNDQLEELKNVLEEINQALYRLKIVKSAPESYATLQPDDPFFDEKPDGPQQIYRWPLTSGIAAILMEGKLDFRELIRRQLRVNKITQKSLAERVKITPANLSNYLKGEKDLHSDTVQAILQALISLR